MDITCGIVGLPNVGKSTLFNALTSGAAATENYPFCTIEPNISIIPVPDERLDKLAEIYSPGKVTPAVLEFFDIAGLVKGASRGEGLGNQFLHHIRNVSAILHVVRCFEDENITHIEGAVNPIRDIETVETELILRDLESVEKKIDTVAKQAKSGEKKIKEELEIYIRLRDHLSGGGMARYFSYASNEKKNIQDLHLLTLKPVMYIANVDEAGISEGNPMVEAVTETALRYDSPVVRICTKLESEISRLSPGEQKLFLEEMGIRESGLNQVILAAYRLLDLITFFTGNANEVRAWSVRRGSSSYEAAGEIHSDFQRGFIRAEVFKVPDLARLGSESAVRDEGKMHSHGRDYVVQDGDVILFKFNV